MGFWGSLWMLLVIGCLAALVMVVSTINQVRDDLGEDKAMLVGSVWAWVIGTLLGAVVWLFIVVALLGFGFDHGAGGGTGSLLANILLFGGPALYLFSSYRRIENAKALGRAQLAAASVEDADTT